jgi:hypothetical protein
MADGPSTTAAPQALAPRRTGSRPHPAPWFILAALVAAAIGYGFLLQPPRADPFAAPTPLISLAWWLYPQPHRAMTAAEAVPVGTRGAFISRRGAEGLNDRVLLDAIVDEAGSGFVITRGNILGNSGVVPTSLIRYDRGVIAEEKTLPRECVRLLPAADGKGALPGGLGCRDRRTANGAEVAAIAVGQSRVYALLHPGVGSPIADVKGGTMQQFPNAAAPVSNRWSSAQQSAPNVAKGGPAESGTEAAIAWAPPGKSLAELDWTVLAEQPAFKDLRDLAVANDDSFGIAVGENGTAVRFDSAGKITTPDTEFRGKLSSVRIAKDGFVWAVSPLDDAGRRTVLVSYDQGNKWLPLGQRRSPAPWTTYLAIPFFLFTLGGGIRAAILQRKLDEAGMPYVSDIPTNDRPIGLADHDSLNFRPIARAVELFIRNINTEPPIIIAITGEWGSGKSSLMNLIKEMLERGGARPVWFNAWHHQKEESLLAALLENIRGQAIPRFWTWPGLSFRLRLLRRRLGRELRGIVALFVFTGALALLLYVSGIPTLAKLGLLSKWQNFASPQDLLALPVIVAVPFLGWRLLQLLKVFPDSAAAMLAQMRRPRAGDIRDKLNFRYRFAREFEETADVLRTPLNPGMVIFIDDLDRCRPENVVEILEALNFISGAGKCVVVMGISKRMVSRAIWRAHEDLFKDEWGVASENTLPQQRAELQRKHQAFSENYLEKLINIELALPLPTDEQSQGLLMPPPDPPAWRGWAASIRTTMDWFYELGPSLVAACLLLLALYLTPPPPAAKSEPPAQAVATQPAGPSPTAAPSRAAAMSPSAAPRQAAPFAPLSPAALEAKYADHSWAAQVAIGFVCLLLLATFAIRYIVLASRAKVSDTPDFEAALQLWAPVVRDGRPTPRFLKRYKNRVRYFAMRMRPMPEEEHAADRIARWLYERFGRKPGQTPAAAEPQAGAGVHETNVVALTALRVLDPALVANGQGNLLERVLALSAAANDNPKKRLLREIADTLEAHEARSHDWGARPIDVDLLRFNEVDPQEAPEVATEDPGPDRTPATAVQLA